MEQHSGGGAILARHVLDVCDVGTGCISNSEKYEMP